jgi:hypothetical protein
VLLTGALFYHQKLTRPLMSQISPWYSIRQRDGNIFHDDDQCPRGRAIEEKYRMKGHRCRQRCGACARLRDPATLSIRLAQLTSL